jgi:hypothetical protein
MAVAGIISGVITDRLVNREKSERFYRIVAFLFLFLSIAILSSYFFRLFTGSLWPSIVPGLSQLIRIGDGLWFFLLGYGFVIIARSVRMPSEAMRKTMVLSKWGIIIRIAGYFIFVTLGKSRHMDEMIVFFTASGYSESFLYVILILECLGALGIILDFYFRTGIFAAIGLIILMAGAILTHVRNGDPLTDSDDAFRQMTGLIFLVMLFYLESVVNRKLAKAV